MPIPLYLALTGAEFSQGSVLPEKAAWLGCHFSSEGLGLCGLPEELPASSLLILDDRTPPGNCNIPHLRDHLLYCLEANRCCGLLLDFQRANDANAAKLAAELQSLPYPVCVSHLYAKGLSCPVFLPPCPLTLPLSEHLAPWKKRTVWLDITLESVCFTVTEQGCTESLCSAEGSFPFRDNRLHCHYRIEQTKDRAMFFLRRTSEDLSVFLEEAQALGVSQAVGLWQELS